ncbi:MAG: hypothetical protein WC848_03645 [Parcubacteria group bacterium]|jgi:hypothetical protein
MHQTFYIDIDEEITSIVEKLRKAEAPEAVLVVPKRALLIQSIVNLKLLRKEADNLGLKVSIVTQDKLGKLLIQKAGISIQQKVEDDYEEVAVDSMDNRKFQPKKGELKKEIETAELENPDEYNKRRLEKIGSADFFVSNNETDNFTSRENDWKELEEIKGERPVLTSDSISNKKNEFDRASDSQEDGFPNKGRISSMDVSVATRPVAVPKRVALRTNTRVAVAGELGAFGVQNSAIRPMSRKTVSTPPPEATDDFPIPYSKTRPNYLQDEPDNSTPGKKTDPRDQQLEKFFYANSFSDKNKTDYSEKAGGQKGSGGSKFLRVLAILGAIAFSAGLLYVAYLYVPKATITISAKKEVKSVDMELLGNVNSEGIDYEKSEIPAKLLEFDEEVAKTFNATGKKNASNQKAKGKITIYNEFSSSPQPLVATTRFMTDDQKVFRLVQGVTIPGTTSVSGEVKPGVVEAEVVADEAGSGYNIGATTFSIPGFKNSENDKYAKIYAKSSVAMSGGGDGNEEVTVVTAKDISDAKDKLSLEINSTVKQKVKDSADSGTIILDDAIAIEEPVYRLSNSEGETTNSFEIKVSAHVRALVFFESDAKKIANSAISKSGNGKINIDAGSVIIDYGKAVPDFKAETIEIKMHASNVMQPNLDLANLKKGLLGKNSEELADYLKTYSNIEKAEVEYWPPVFVNKIPLNEKRVDVVLNATMPE